MTKPLSGDVVESCERLIAKWRKIAANIEQMIPVSVEVQSMGKSCAEHADELEAALSALRETSR